MKKILFLAIALAAMVVVSSCSKEQTGGIEAKPARLSIKLAGVVGNGTRNIEEPGKTAPGTIQLDNGHIFVITTTGDVYHSVPLDVAKVTGDSPVGQVLTVDVPSDAGVYIIGNIPESNGVVSETTFNNIKIAEAAISTQQEDYTLIALANKDGEPEPIVVDPTAPLDEDTGTVEATVTVVINPLISRIELAKVTGGEKVTAFNVTGVYMDDWHPSFTFGGLFAGTMYEQHMSTDFTGNALKEEGSWPATGTPLAAIPENAVTAGTDVWAYNLASGGLPRLIIALDGVKYMADVDDDPLTPDVEVTEDEPLYLTVTEYEGIDTFDRGVIYNIGGLTGAGITFDPDDTGFTPNPEGVTLKVVEVKVEEWVIETPDAVL